jgi:hypothetical protein
MSVHVARTDPDDLAFQLAAIARRARLTAPCWDGAGISVPVLSPGLGTLGRVLPGRGLYLADDLKNLGITRPIAHVYERSKVAWLVDMFRDASFEKAEALWRGAERLRRGQPLPPFIRDPEQGAITTYDGIIAARVAKGEDRTITKTTITTTANAWSSLWRAGGMPGAGTYTNIPTGSAPSKDAAGSWSYSLTNPTAPDKKYLLTLGYGSQVQINTLCVVDLLVGLGNILCNTTGSQTLSSTALTRYTTGEGVLPVLVVTTALGATTGTGSITSYTDQAGNTGNAGQAFSSAASTIVEKTLPNSGTFNGSFVPLAVADYGVRAVSTFAWTTTPTSGVVAMDLCFVLGYFPGIAANFYLERDSTIQIDGLTEIAQTSGNVLGCISAYVLAGATTTGTVTAFMRTCAG